MQPFKIFLWAGTIAMMVIMGSYGNRFVRAGVDGIVALEFAGAEKGVQIISSWEKKDLMPTANLLMFLDFIFIVFYVMLMLRCSTDQMNLEKSLWLNSVLRLNLLLAILTGLLDVIENSIMIHNLQDPDDYIRSYLFTLPKFIFAAWVIFWFLVSVVKRWILRLARR